MSAKIDPSASTVQEQLLWAVDELAIAYGGDHKGLAGNVLPMFLVVGVKE